MVRDGAVASGESGGSFGGIGSIPPAAIPSPMALTDLAIRNLKPSAKPFKASDSGELHLLVSPNGSRLWRLKDRYEGKEKLLALGAYPIVTLAKAREKRDAAKARLADGIDPAKSRRESRIAAVAISGNTFRLVAEEYLDKLRREAERPPLWRRSNGCCPSPMAISASVRSRRLPRPRCSPSCVRWSSAADGRAPGGCDRRWARSSAMPSPPRAPRTIRPSPCGARWWLPR